jgi:cytoskeletal protein CcmA (bactofilin family)
VFNKRKPDDAKPQDDDLPPLPLNQYLYPPAAEEPPAPEPLPPAPPTPAFKEFPMARSPFAPPLPTNPNGPPPLRPAPSGSSMSSTGPREEGARRTLVVGRGISVQGTVQDAERLVVEGTVEATMINGLTELSIAHGGIFKGEVEVDEAEVAGTIDGTVTARNALIVRGSGRVLGTARCRRLQVEDGGQITGRIEMLSNSPVAPEAE